MRTLKFVEIIQNTSTIDMMRLMNAMIWSFLLHPGRMIVDWIMKNFCPSQDRSHCLEIARHLLHHPNGISPLNEQTTDIIDTDDEHYTIKVHFSLPLPLSRLFLSVFCYSIVTLSVRFFKGTCWISTRKSSSITNDQWRLWRFFFEKAQLCHGLIEQLARSTDTFSQCSQSRYRLFFHCNFEQEQIRLTLFDVISSRRYRQSTI